MRGPVGLRGDDRTARQRGTRNAEHEHLKSGSACVPRSVFHLGSHSGSWRGGVGAEGGMASAKSVKGGGESESGLCV